MTTEAIASAAPAAPAQAAAATAAPAAVVATAIATPEATPAAPAAPAAPATPTPPAEPAAEEGAFGQSVTYEPTGDANLDLALSYFGKHGLNHEHPAVQAATKGNFSLLRASLAEKGLPGWEAHLAIAEQGYKDFSAAEAAKVVAVQNICVSAAGSEQEWADVLSFASQNADPDEKVTVNAALAQGGVVAEAMAAYLVNLYRGAPGTSYAPQEKAVQPSAARGTPAASNGPLSPREYVQAVQELRRTRGSNFEATPEYAQLNQRRQMYRG